MVEELKRLWEEGIKSGNFVSLVDGDRLVAMPLVMPGRRARRVYLGECGHLYYRRGNHRFRLLGGLGEVERLSLVRSPLRPKKERKLPRAVENVFKFFRLASPDLNPSIWKKALSYLEELKVAMGAGGDPKRIYRALGEGGWKVSYPLPDSLWHGARLRDPWSSLRSLTGMDWDVEGGLKKLAEEALANGRAQVSPPTLKYNVKVGFLGSDEPPGYETNVSVEYRGLAHGHYGLLVNWRGTVFLAETD